MKSRPTPIWDLPTRLFHWSLPPLLAASWASGPFQAAAHRRRRGGARPSLRQACRDHRAGGSDERQRAPCLCQSPSRVGSGGPNGAIPSVRRSQPTLVGRPCPGVRRQYWPYASAICVGSLPPPSRSAGRWSLSGGRTGHGACPESATCYSADLRRLAVAGAVRRCSGRTGSRPAAVGFARRGCCCAR